jgi:hypothetical protein
VRVPFESVEYLSGGAAIDNPIEGGAPVRQPDVEPSNKLQLVAFAGTRHQAQTSNEDIANVEIFMGFSTSNHPQRAGDVSIPEPAQSNDLQQTSHF